ncbi:MAG: hypothetical protein ACK515_15085 [bacterium]|jgi:hypothetical protein|nr:hypothetical protein [Betaproteobacteria bacterium]
MTTPALTHHDIVRLVEPFARAGRAVDLAASDRAARRIVFKPRDVQVDPRGGPAWHETLALDCSRQGFFVLQRTLVGPGGACATLQASGTDAGDLLAHIDAVPAATHFSVGAGYIIARSYDADLPRGARPAPPGGVSPLVLSRAQVQVEGLELALFIRLPHLRSVAADIALTPATGPRPDLPEDLLAVLGWDWARLIPNKEGWSSKLRLRGPVLRRSRTAEAALEQVAAHLARVMAESPERFHDRHRLARWSVVARRGIPSLTMVLMVVGALLLPSLTDPSNAGLWMALHYVPIGLLAVAFSLQELPQLEIPPWPRRPRAGGWTAGAEPGTDRAG